MEFLRMWMGESPRGANPAKRRSDVVTVSTSMSLSSWESVTTLRSYAHESDAATISTERVATRLRLLRAAPSSSLNAASISSLLTRLASLVATLRRKDATLLIYLNTVEEGKGGRTVFVEDGLAVKPVEGTALLYKSKTEVRKGARTKPTRRACERLMYL